MSDWQWLASEPGPFAVAHRVPLRLFGSGEKRFVARGVWRPPFEETKCKLDQPFSFDPTTVGPE